MLKTKNLKQLFTPQTLFLAGLVATLGLSLFALSLETRAESTVGTYTDNAGGQQNMRITKADGERRPAIVFVHGGGWATDGGTFGPDFQNRAAKWGYTSFRINYRLMPGGVYEQLQDVMRAVKHVRDNADQYNIDPNRVAIWGDSAGGSLTARAAASGKSGAAAAVGWSAPTNAFRDMFNSAPGFIDGLFHTRCFGEYLPPFTMDAINFFNGNRSVLERLASGAPLSQDQSARLLSESLQLGGLVLEQLPATAGKLQKAANDFGVTINDEALAGNSVKAPTPTISEGEVKQKLTTLTAEDLEKIGTAIYEFERATSNLSGDAEKTAATISLIKLGLNQLSDIQGKIVQEKAAAGTPTDTTDTPGLTPPTNSPLINNGSNGGLVGINPQQISASKIAQCIDDFVELSPALFASPRTPPMFLAVAANEELVNAQDAYQMRDKLRSMGIRSEALVLSGNRHMGYDERAEVPSFQFLNSILRP
ncbi:alpha/beta hydrolase [Candidatus Saccharibacteria bacterium]|nr:alpha/beta hydrolase [Candidatus Saccharibacteria bacterium]MBH2007513.1 alpha/beta hydrolase [Candidatus Saccharibacteria bacterium]